MNFDPGFLQYIINRCSRLIWKNRIKKAAKMAWKGYHYILDNTDTPPSRWQEEQIKAAALGDDQSKYRLMEVLAEFEKVISSP